MSDLIRHFKDLLWDRAFEAGRRMERREIIKLLQANNSKKALRLIKGEQK